MKKHLIASAVALALGASSVAFADDTTSSIRGTILSPQGSPAANTKIIVTHVPTGTVRTYTTNNSGAFNAAGLQVGGPYKVVIDSDTFRDKEITIAALELGNPLILRESLEAIAGETITITASASSYRSLNSASESVFGSREIGTSPTIDRDLKGVLKRNPLVNILDNDEASISVAGANPRYNSLVIDGIRVDDDFGLNGSGYPTQRSPISLDAVEQIAIENNPYDPSKGGFSGAGISVVTKSGTNEFSGSVFYEYNDDKFAGPSVEDGEIIPTAFNEKMYGFSVGGPILKDKLFFFANYEKFEEDGAIEAGPSDYASGAPARVNTADALEVIRIARDVYGLDAGTWERATVEEDEKKLFKLDYNINEFHRATLTYQNTAGTRTSGNIGGDTLNLSSNWYNRGDDLTTTSVQWYADWSNEFSTELRISDKDVDNTQDPLNGRGFGQIRVATASGDVEFGPDRSRHANELSNDTFQIFFEGEYLSGDHTYSFGYVYDDLDVFNIFIQNSLGIWEFDSLADFENRTASDFQYQNADSNVAADGAAEFSFQTHTLYFGDSWAVSPDFTLNYGVRYESISTSDKPRLNPNFVTRYENLYGFDNTATLDGKDIILPRIGFEYFVSDETRLSGGVGRFSGGRPNVWISNSYTNDGVTIVRPDLGAIADPAVYLENVDPTQIPQEVQDVMAAGNGNSTPIDPNFEIPSEWRYSLQLDTKVDLPLLGNDWDFATQVIYKNIDKDVQWVDMARSLAGTTVDGRPIYEPRFGPNQWDLLLTNAEGGDSTVTTFSLDKQWDNGLRVYMAYTNQDINDRVPGTSSTATSNYQFTTVYDRQNPGVGTAAYEVKHRFNMNIDYSVEFFEGYATKFSLIAERVSGRPYSWTLGSFRDGDFGDQFDFDDSDVYLPYIPTGAADPAVDFSCGGCLSYEEIIAHLSDNGIPTAGGYLGRNDYTSPYRTNIDLFVAQEVPGIFDGNKGEVYFTIDNFLNMIDSSQGKIYSNRFGENQQILFDYDLNGNGQYQYREPFGGFRYGSPARFREIESAWRMKIGVRYTF